MKITPHGLAELGVIVVAAGRGERLGANAPKAFVEIDGRTLLEHAIRTVTGLPHRGQLVLVVPGDHAADALALVESVLPHEDRWQVSVVHGGAERHESVAFGLLALHESIETVLVHDAARPLTPSTVFERVISAVHESREATIPVIAVTDTLKHVTDDGTITATIDRSSLVAVQTPQGFDREMLVAAYAAPAEHPDETPTAAPTDDAEVMQRFGARVRTVPGSPFSHKLTTSADFLVLDGLLRSTDPLTPAEAAQ